jgi:phosphoglycolate phosphatase
MTGCPCIAPEGLLARPTKCLIDTIHSNAPSCTEAGRKIFRSIRVTDSTSIELVVFDIAGTTVQDIGFVERAFLSVAAEHGLGLDSAWIKPRMGVNKLAVMREALECGRSGTAATAEELASSFENAIDREVESGAAPALPGAAELIRDLQAAGVRVAFTTGFSRKTALHVLEVAGLEGDAIVASDEVAKGRPAPDLVFESMRRTGVPRAANVAVVGDTPSDLGCGTAAGASLVVGIGHGTHSLTELSHHPHTDLVPDLYSLRELLSQHVLSCQSEQA